MDGSPADAASLPHTSSDLSLPSALGPGATFELAGSRYNARRTSRATGGYIDPEQSYGLTMEEDLKVWPEGALPASKIALRKPDFDGANAFEDLKQALYAKAEGKEGGTKMKFDLRVQDGEIGYFLDRGGGLHLLRPGRHLRLPGSLDGALYACSLNADEVHLPPPSVSGETLAMFHVIRVNPGEFVCARQGGRPTFLAAGVDAEGFPVPGYHVIEGDRTFEVMERVEVTKPIIQNGSSFIVNVLPGFYCKAMITSRPLLLGSGQHHINVAGFSIPNPASAFVNVNEVYIEHGVIHIIRVAPHQMFKAMIQGQAVVFESRPEPYVFNDPTFRMAGSNVSDSFVNVTDKYIEHQTLHEIKLDVGEIALVWLENRPLILGSQALFGRAAIDEYGIDVATDDPHGRHYKFKSPNFRMVKDPNGKYAFRSLGDMQFIRHGTVYIIRVRQGELCRVWEGSKPVILAPKDDPYVFNSSVFRLASMEKDGYGAYISQSEKVIEHGVHHIITVPSGQVCLVWHDGNARILGSELVPVTLLGPPGSVASFQRGEERDGGSAVPIAASSGTSTMVSAKYDDSGEIRPVAGRRYEVQSTNFRLAAKELDGYDAWAYQSDKCIRHGSVALITVEDGEVAVVRNNGKRQALGPGRYRLEAPQQVFEKHLYTGVRTTAPEEIVTYDSQRIPIRVKFTVTYEIQDPSKAAQYRGKDTDGDGSNDLDIFLRTACHSCLRASVNHTHILEMGKGGELKRLKEMQEKESREKAVAAGSVVDLEGGVEGTAAFADQFHVAFEHQNHTLVTQLERVGVALIDLSIQDWTIDDTKVVSQLESLAMQTVEAQVSNAKNQSLAVAEKLSAEGRAASEIARANGDAAVTQARIDAENSAKLSKARTALQAGRIEAEAREIKAKAEADAILITAEAESRAIALRGGAEAAAKRKKLNALSYTPSAEWMRQLQVACAATLKGAKLTVAPEGLTNLYSLLNTANPVFSGMRGIGGGAAGVADVPAPVSAPAPAAIADVAAVVQRVDSLAKSTPASGRAPK